jgi:hypothetical protein
MSKQKLILLSFFAISALNAESINDVMDGFDDEPVVKPVKVKKTIKKSDATDELMDGFDGEPSKQVISKKKEVPDKPLIPAKHKDDIMSGFDDEPVNSAKDEDGKLLGFLGGLTGKFTEQVAFAVNDDAPHDNINSVKSSLFLDYEHKFDNDFKFKINGKAYYDAIYDLRGKEKYSADELDELRDEVEIYDAYIEGSLTDKLDMKLGRQVVVWGRSDTIRVTDILNPLDNRRPGMVDIEDLRLPVAMAKFDYFLGDWRVTPMAIIEQRFSKNPPAGSAFNASPTSIPDNEDYSDVSPALSVGAEFSGWDVNFYAAKIRDDAGYFDDGKIKHDKVNMFGTAVNVLNGSWLFKSELAHLDGLKYTTTSNREFKRTDALLGAEYNGIADTLISYDVAVRKIHDYDARLINEPLSIEEESYQHAFRVSSDFMNATVKVNYLISLFGKGLDEGGFQRAWAKYDIADGIFANIGYVDYMGGSKRFDAVKNNDMAFVDVTYSF